ncbi:hypothetical protein LBYZC6_06070 [Lacrimispora brassicae]
MVMYQPKLRKRRNGVPIMSNAEIDSHAEQFLKDYNPTVLKNPQPVNIEAFAEIYLDLTVDYTYLSHCGLILGRMVFQDTERVPVYLPKEKCADYLYVERGTMMIDNTVLENWKEYRLRSTIGHECGHWIFHSDYYTHASRHNGQDIKSLPGITGCKKTDIEGAMEPSGRRQLISDIDWLEHQAKYFSAAILMPKTPFIDVASDLLGSGQLNRTDLANVLAETFQVSSVSANIRLSQLGFNRCIEGEEIITKEKYITYTSGFQALCE